eukprot:TRINITY_DN1026_c1_g2_i2.p1 TRINITY_DN1026_c1_g2~~TRINITY_DN1026_c1_g2_i2.p1  ORF type:complete len:710 (+),score=266.22 TRINITY_DN1026_c1_g2_i2:131-2260(+)
MRALLCLAFAALLAAADPVPGDECVDAVSINVPGTFEFDTNEATSSDTLEAGSLSCSENEDDPANDLFFRTQLIPEGAEVTISTCGLADFDTLISVYDADCASEVTCNDNNCDSSQSLVTFTGWGEAVTIRIGGAAGSFGSGSFTVEVNEAVLVYVYDDRFEPQYPVARQGQNVMLINKGTVDRTITIGYYLSYYVPFESNTMLSTYNLYNTENYMRDADNGYSGTLVVASAVILLKEDGVEPDSVDVQIGEWIVWSNAADFDISFSSDDGWAFAASEIAPGYYYLTSLWDYGTFPYTTSNDQHASITVIECYSCDYYGATCGEVVNNCGDTLYCGGCYYNEGGSSCCNSVTHTCGVCYDECVDALEVKAPGSVQFDTRHATTSGPDVSCAESFSHDLFFRVPSVQTGFGLIASTCGGANWDTVIALYHEGESACQSEDACSDDNCEGTVQSSAETYGTGGSITVRVGGYNADSSGSGRLDLTVFREVLVKDDGFSPSIVVMVQGQSIRFVNDGEASRFVAGEADGTTWFSLTLGGEELRTTLIPTGSFPFGTMPFSDWIGHNNGTLVVVGGIINVFTFGLQSSVVTVLPGVPVAWYNVPYFDAADFVVSSLGDDEEYESPPVAPGDYFMRTYEESGYYRFRTSTGHEGAIYVTSPCDYNPCSQICIPHFDGTFECACEPGYYMYHGDWWCQDINECNSDCGESGCEMP